VRSKGGRCLTNLLHSCAVCLEIWRPHTPGTLRVCPGLYRDCVTFLLLCVSVYIFYHQYTYGFLIIMTDFQGASGFGTQRNLSRTGLTYTTSFLFTAQCRIVRAYFIACTMNCLSRWLITKFMPGF